MAVAVTVVAVSVSVCWHLTLDTILWRDERLWVDGCRMHAVLRNTLTRCNHFWWLPSLLRLKKCWHIVLAEYYFELLWAWRERRQSQFALQWLRALSSFVLTFPSISIYVAIAALGLLNILVHSCCHSQSLFVRYSVSLVDQAILYFCNCHENPIETHSASSLVHANEHVVFIFFYPWMALELSHAGVGQLALDAYLVLEWRLHYLAEPVLRQQLLLLEVGLEKETCGVVKE